MSKILSKIDKKKKELLERKIGGKQKQNRLRPICGSEMAYRLLGLDIYTLYCSFYIHKKHKYSS